MTETDDSDSAFVGIVLHGSERSAAAIALTPLNEKGSKPFVDRAAPTPILFIQSFEANANLFLLFLSYPMANISFTRVNCHFSGKGL